MNCTALPPLSIDACRLCTKRHEYYVNIFISNESCEIIVEEAIQDLLGLPVAVGDGLPNVVCRLCLRKLIEFRDFKNMCFKSATELRAYGLGNDLFVSKTKDEDAADGETLREGSSQENTFLNDIQVTEVYITTPDEFAIGTVCHAKEEWGSFENVLLVKEEVNDGRNYTEGGAPVTALTGVAVDPLAADTMCPVKDEFQPMHLLGMAKSGTWSNCVNGESRVPVAPNDLSLDLFASKNQSDTKEVCPRDPLGEYDDCGEEDFADTEFNEDAAVCSESKKLTMDDQADGRNCQSSFIKEESNREYEVSDSDLLEMGFSGFNMTSPASGNEIELRKTYLLTLDEEYCSEDVTCSDFFQRLLLDLKITKPHTRSEHVQEEDMPCETEVGATSNNGDNFDVDHSSVKPIPTVTSEPIMVDCCNNIGKLTLEPENESDKFVADRQWISQDEVLNDPSCDPVREQNLQLEQSMANSFVVNCLPEEKVKNQRKNFSFYALSKKKLSQLNNRASPIRNQERGQSCHQAENSNYPTDYICNYCSTRYLEKKSLAVHIKRHMDVMRSKSVLPKKDNPPRFSENLLGKAFRCNECRKMFSTKRDIRRHLLVHSGVKQFKCNECGKMFTQRSSLNTHSVIHTGVKRFKCNECGKMFTQKGNLKTHTLIHTGVKQFKCNECGKMFTTKGDLKNHSVVHTGVKRFKCNECGKMFTQKGNLKTHTLIHTGVKRFKCNECGKMFTHRCSLNTHTLIHTGVKRFKCNECGKIFTKRSGLNKHSVIHTGVKRFKCNECGKMFTTKGDLKNHSVVHTGVKRFKCNECGKMFTQKGNLKTHTLIHTGVKRFKCNECGKMFTHRSSLNKHSLVHTGVKPFNCNECGKMFTRKSSLKTHSRTHTGVKRFNCNECG